MEIVRNEGSAARDHLANERTFLAWLRTALGIVGLGLLLERFELDEGKTAAGMALVVFGCISLLYALIRYLRIARHLADGTFPIARVGPFLFGMGALVLVVAALLMGCGGSEVAPPATAPARSVNESASASADPTVRGANGAPCLVPEDCDSGICEGEGCGASMPGHCVPAVRACTRDLVTYCGCDGLTFRGSGSCPGARYERRGRCDVSSAHEAR